MLKVFVLEYVYKYAGDFVIFSVNINKLVIYPSDGCNPFLQLKNKKPPSSCFKR